jgi:hypothetical protein
MRRRFGDTYLFLTTKNIPGWWRGPLGVLMTPGKKTAGGSQPFFLAEVV